MTRLVIVGGSDAGISAALRARELDATAEVTVVVADRYPNFSICGLPYFLSGEVPDWHRLAHRTRQEIEGAGVRLLLDHTASAIHTKRQSVELKPENGQAFDMAYDRLVIATGAIAVTPEIPGIHLPGVFPLRFMEDSFTIHRFLKERGPASAVIIGGGYIGLEMAGALTARGIAVTMIEHGPVVMKTIAPRLGQCVQDELVRHGVKVITEASVTAIETESDGLRVLTGHSTVTAPMVLCAVGVKPNTVFGQSAGLTLGAGGALRVNRAMETGAPAIYAAGDCTETFHGLLQKPVYLPLGSTAHKQGRIAGGNAVGGRQEFAGTFGTQVVKVFDLAVARTGLNGAEALNAGYDPLTVETTAWDHKAYYPGVCEVHLHIIGDRPSGRLLGAQIVGHRSSEIAKRIDVFAVALSHGMTVDALSDLDLSYTPPFGSPWDVIQIGAQAWEKQRREPPRPQAS